MGRPEGREDQPRPHDLSDEAFVRAIVGDRPDLFGMVQAPKAPEPLPTAKGSKE